MAKIYENLLEKVNSRKTGRQQRLFFSTALLGLLNGFQENDFQNFSEDCVTETLDFFETFTETDETLYNKYWIDLNTYALKVAAKTLVHISKKSPQRSLAVLSSLVQCPSLDLEKLAPAARERMTKNFGDPRDVFAKCFEILWAFIEEKKKLSYIETVILFMLTSPSSKKIACQLYREILKSKPTNEVIISTIHALDSFAREGKLDQDFERFFMPFLESVLGTGQQIEKFEEFRNGIRLLVDLSKASTRVEKTFAISQLLTYLKRIGEHRLYIKYISRLSSLHSASQMHIEAGKSILLHAQELDWDLQKQLGPLRLSATDYPAQSEFHRKKSIYEDAIQSFQKANCWEFAIDLMREMQAPLREQQMFSELSTLLFNELELVNYSLDKDRLYSSFFRVGCYGNGCPLWMRNKEFIWRGSEGDRQASFIEKMKNTYPAASTINHRDKVAPSYNESPGIHFQIFPVSVSCKEEITTFCAIPDRAKGKAHGSMFQQLLNHFSRTSSKDGKSSQALSSRHFSHLKAIPQAFQPKRKGKQRFCPGLMDHQPFLHNC